MILSIILSIFATYRIAHMLATEEGAFSLFANIRERFDPRQDTWVGRGLNCALCIGFWTALVIALLIPFATWQEFLLNWLGIAGAQAALHIWLEQ